VLTVDFDRLGLRPGDPVLDLGCGAGRHAFEAARLATGVVALDRRPVELESVATMFQAMRLSGDVDTSGLASVVVGDAGCLPFPSGTFAAVIAAEVLEHLPADRAALGELVRVLRPGGTLAVTVPRWWPERICWALTADYHAPSVVDGHVRIYGRRGLQQRLAEAGVRPTGHHYAHGLHSPYWWLKCAVGLDRADHPAVALYHRFLVWDIVTPQRWVRRLERWLNPIMGKSLVVYATKLGGRPFAARPAGAPTPASSQAVGPLPHDGPCPRL